MILLTCNIIDGPVALVIISGFVISSINKYNKRMMELLLISNSRYNCSNYFNFMWFF